MYNTLIILPLLFHLFRFWIVSANTEDSFTFKSSRFVTAELVEPPTEPVQSDRSLVQYSKIYQSFPSTVFLQGTNFTEELSDNHAKYLVSSKGFAHSVFSAYLSHNSLVIRPDDIWTAILVQFSYHVNAHGEELRDHFVNFSGKKELTINYTLPIYAVPIEDFISRIGDEIEKNIKPNISSWVLPNFSTTRKDDKITAGAILMGTLKNYFDYTLSIILCGVPEITILGTIQDWRDIRDRISQIPKYSKKGMKWRLQKWSEWLTEIVEEFIKVKKDRKLVNFEFWEDIVRHRIKSIGCGYKQTYLNGWLTVFSVFDKDGKWQVQGNGRKKRDISQGSYDICAETFNQTRTDDFSSPWPTLAISQLTEGTIQVPVKIVDVFAGDMPKNTYNASIFAGHVGHSVLSDGKTIRPLMGWAMAVVGSAPEYLLKVRIQDKHEVFPETFGNRNKDGQETESNKLNFESSQELETKSHYSIVVISSFAVFFVCSFVCFALLSYRFSRSRSLNGDTTHNIRHYYK